MALTLEWMTELDRAAIRALKALTPPIANELDSEGAALTPQQRAFVWRMAYAQRKQITNQAVVTEAVRRRGAKFATRRPA